MLEGRVWYRQDGASPDEIEQLKRVAPVDLPESYLSLLSFSNGGEGPLPVRPFNFCLDAVEQVIENEQIGTFHEFFPKLFVIGGNGGGEAIAFDLRGAEPFPLVAFDMTNATLSESVLVIAESFDAALELIGIEEPSG